MDYNNSYLDNNRGLMDDVDGERQIKIKKWKKARYCSICFLVTGIVMIVMCGFTPKVMNTIISS